MHAVIKNKIIFHHLFKDNQLSIFAACFQNIAKFAENKITQLEKSINHYRKLPVVDEEGVFET